MVFRADGPFVFRNVGEEEVGVGQVTPTNKGVLGRKRPNFMLCHTLGHATTFAAVYSKNRSLHSARGIQQVSDRPNHR